MHPAWREVWEVYGEPYGENAAAQRKRQQKLQRVLNKYPDLDTSVAMVQRHFRCHDPEQPTAPSRVAERAEREAYGLLPSQVELLAYVAQMGKAGLADTVLQFHTSPSRASSRLNALSKRGYLLRKRKEKFIKRGGPRVVFYLTPLGRAILNELHRDSKTEARWLHMKAITSVKDVGERVAHDLGCNYLVGLLAEAATSQPEHLLRTKSGESQFRLSVLRENCLGSGQIALGSKTPGYFEGAIHIRRGEKINVLADALVVLGVKKGDALDIACAFFFEYDTGSKWAKGEGFNKLFSYVLLDRAKDAPVGRRLPDFAGCRVPVLMSTEDDTKRPRELLQPDAKDRRRAQQIMEAFSSKVASVSWDDDHDLPDGVTRPLPPILLALTPELKAHGWETLVWCLHLPGMPRYPLLAALLAAYEPVQDQLPLKADGIARLDLDEAKPDYSIDESTVTLKQLQAEQQSAVAFDRQTAAMKERRAR